MQTQSPIGRKIFLSFWIFVSALSHTQSQNHDFLHFTTREGLPSNYVYGVIEDDRGYIWAYTENGLAKFDGYSFQNFSVSDGLPGNDVVHALKDDEGKIWLWTYNNRPSYLYEDNIHIVEEQPMIMGTKVDGKVFYSKGTQNYKTMRSLADGKIIDISIKQTQSLIFTQTQPIFLTHKVDIDMIRAVPDFFIQDMVRGLPADRADGNYISCPPGSVYTLSQDSIRLYRISKLVTGMLFADGYLYILHESKQVFWKKGKKHKSFETSLLKDVETKRQLKIYQLGKDEKYLVSLNDLQFALIDIKKEDVKLINPDDYLPTSHKVIAVTILESSFLLCFPEGFVEFDFEGNFQDRWEGGDWSKNYSFRRAYKDSKANIWIGTRDGGLLMIPAQKRNGQLLNNHEKADLVFEQLIKTKKGKLLGITDRANIYHIEGKDLKMIHKSRGRYDFRSAGQTPSGIWVSSSGEGIIVEENTKGFKIENIGEKFQTHFSDRVSIHNQELWSGFINQRMQAYHVEEQAVYTASNQRIEIRKFTSPKKLRYSAIDAVVNCIYYHPTEHKVFVGNSEGLFAIEKDSLMPLIMNTDDRFQVSALYGTSDFLWIGTESKGGFKFNLRSGTLTSFSQARQIQNIRPYQDSSLLIVSKSRLWVSSWKNFAYDNRPFDEHEGLSSSEVLDAVWDGGQGVYVATVRGLNFLNLSKKYSTKSSSKDLQITSFQVNNQEVLFNQSFILKHFENNLSIQFHLMSHASNGRVRYFTRLKPYQENWQETTQRSVNYFSLPPGDYIFELKAEDYFKNLVHTHPLSFRIKKAFWQSAWFVTSLVALFVYLVFYIFSLREKAALTSLLQEKQINRRMADLELSALRAQMNPHFVFNALGAIQFYIQTHEVETADNYLTQFAKLMRKYLDSSKEKIISLSEEIELLEIYTELEKLRFEDLFTVEIEIDHKILMEDHFVPSMLIQPYVENAINHGLNERRDKKGELTIKFYQEGESLLCLIQDNGIGRENSKKFSRKGHKSRGMQIIKEKIQTLKNAGLADVSVEINDLYPELRDYPGTQVLIRIKNLEYDPI